MSNEYFLKPIDGSSRIISLFSPTDIRLSTVWHIVEGRNAWHSTWFEAFYPQAFSLSPDELKDKCESFRTQGSVFSVCAAPLAVMKHKKRLLGLTPVNERGEASYRSLLEGLTGNRPFSDFQYVDANWLRMFEIPGKVKLQVGYKPVDFVSRSYGGAYRLGWTETKARDYLGFLSYFKELERFIRKTDTNEDHRQP
jgi:hypothetical protein